MEWTLETYRLDEITRKFDLPCVVCVTEGIYSETDTEGFSQGDIISIDSEMVLHKVAANFAFMDTNKQLPDPTYVDLTEKEILVPLNYKGKLKVLRDVLNFNSVRELAIEFPRYAKLRENMKVTTEDHVPVTIQAGTVIELDRIIPGHVTGSGKEPDKLVIQFQHRTGDLVVAVSFDAKGKFRTEPDENEYTIKEAINRYSLPQFVKFVDDEIKRVYTQDLLEGIENMRTVTAEILRLNRLVTQNVLVGHYKPLDETQTNDTERFRQRTLAVLPVGDIEVGEIEVNVLKGITEDVYEQVFLVRNVSKTNSAEIVDGSLYVDFATSSGIKIISHQDHEDQQEQDKPPPRPPKPKSLQAKQTDKPKLKPRTGKKAVVDEGYVEFHPAPGPHRKYQNVSPKSEKKKTAKVQTSEPTDYEYPERNPESEYSIGLCMAELSFGTAGAGKLDKSTSKGKELFSNLKNKFKSKEKVSASTDEVQVETRQQEIAPVSPAPIRTSEDYDEVDEWKMTDPSNVYKPQPKPKALKATNPKQVTVDQTSPNPVAVSPISSKTKHETSRFERDKNTNLKPKDVKQKPTAHVAPSNSHSRKEIKLFKDLNNTELVERLTKCGLNDFAEFCRKERLNGTFFMNITKETLEKEMDLTGIPLFKFLQMKDNNWMPT